MGDFSPGESELDTNLGLKRRGLGAGDGTKREGSREAAGHSITKILRNGRKREQKGTGGSYATRAGITSTHNGKTATGAYNRIQARCESGCC